MNLDELSQEFDIYYNNISSNQAPGLDEYEKSVIFTAAQRDLIKALYGKYESNETARRNLNNLIKEGKVSMAEDNKPLTECKLADDVYYIVYEEADLKQGGDCPNIEGVPTYPVKHDELHKIKVNPFRGASNRRVLRVDLGEGSDTIKLISNKDIVEYRYRYVMRPTPIIFNNVEETLEGKEGPIEPCISDSLHTELVELAAQRAAALWKDVK